jgi:steroid 5-alpha reductase family enzyme
MRGTGGFTVAIRSAWLRCTTPTGSGTAGMLERAPAGPVTVLGAAVWLGGFVFESASDWQLARFRANPGNQGLIMDRGLWRYTRHPTTSATSACGGACS